MKKFDELQRETKTLLKSLVNSDMSQDTLDTLTNIDKQLDSMREDHEAVLKENMEIKDKFFDMVKTTSFKLPAEEIEGDDTPKDLDSIISNAINDISKKGD